MSSEELNLQDLDRLFKRLTKNRMIWGNDH